MCRKLVVALLMTAVMISGAGIAVADPCDQYCDSCGSPNAKYRTCDQCNACNDRERQKKETKYDANGKRIDPPAKDPPAKSK